MVRRALAWLRVHPLFAALLMLAVVAVPGFVRMQGVANQQETLIECVQAWGDASVARTALLGGLAQARADALDELVRAVAKQDEQEFAAALAEYLAASDEYRTALEEHPVPEPPSLRCE
jgi:type II secretory pathway pseudopilin PulG